ncbi:MAG: DUF1049 domain-containing protein [Novosphingobium sp.]|nr:DUF1049 domain-containing protein [Novosphingobium sp.]
MSIIKTILWTLFGIAVLIFSWANWKTRVTVLIWENIVVDTNVPALVIVSFLAGLVPTWLILRGTRWQLRRRINSLETAVRSSVASKPENPAPAPDSPAPPQI